MSQFCCEVVQEGPRWVAPALFLLPVPVREVDGVHSFCLSVPPLGVVARELLVREGGEAVYSVGSPYLVVVSEDAGGELPIGVVGLSAESVCLDVRSDADVPGPDGDVVLVGKEEELSQL